MEGSKKQDGNSPFLVSAAALLNKHGLSYEETRQDIVIEGPLGKLKFPRDGWSDMMRFSKALQSKIPLRKKRHVVMVTLPRLSWGAGSAPAVSYSTFMEAWVKKKAEVTFRMWGGAFLTEAHEYERERGYVQLDLAAEHYYNIAMSYPEWKQFSKVNPAFQMQACQKRCLSGKKSGHYHAVHGKYSGSFVAGMPCSPPWKFAPDWVKLNILEREAVGWSKGVAMFPHAGKGVPISAPNWLDGYWPIEGTRVLAQICEAPKNDWTDADWSKLCQLYRTPRAARWGLAEAYSPAPSGKHVVCTLDYYYISNIFPMLEGKGSPVPRILQRIWKADSTAPKVCSIYLLTRLCCDSRVGIVSEGVLGLATR
jgi:hypothetical protein